VMENRSSDSVESLTPLLATAIEDPLLAAARPRGCQALVCMHADDNMPSKYTCCICDDVYHEGCCKPGSNKHHLGQSWNCFYEKLSHSRRTVLQQCVEDNFGERTRADWKLTLQQWKQILHDANESIYPKKLTAEYLAAHFECEIRPSCPTSFNGLTKDFTHEMAYFVHEYMEDEKQDTLDFVTSGWIKQVFRKQFPKGKAPTVKYLKDKINYMIYDDYVV